MKGGGRKQENAHFLPDARNKFLGNMRTETVKTASFYLGIDKEAPLPLLLLSGGFIF